jgi:hypothetical protein
MPEPRPTAAPRPAPREWVVFGDDWGAHPSTSQHLARALGATDRVVWFNSLGMRSPQLTRADLRRIAERLKAMLVTALNGAAGPVAVVDPASGPAPVTGAHGWRPDVLNPGVVPFHLNPLVRHANVHWFVRQWAAAGVGPGAVTLAANPVAAFYAPHSAPFVYLRLDDYARLPGVDPTLAREAETAAYRRARLVVYTAHALKPDPARYGGPTLYLPQAVDAAHFGQVPTVVPDSRTIGFFGLLAEWIDFELIRAVAQRLPDWTFEFMGPVRYAPDWLSSLPNVVLRAGVPYSELPASIGHWRAGWMPFAVNELTRAVNPLKAREYLAAGLPSCGTALPELRALAPDVTIIESVDDMVAFVEQQVATDTAAARAERKKRMQAETWSARAATLRAAV